MSMFILMHYDQRVDFENQIRAERETQALLEPPQHNVMLTSRKEEVAPAATQIEELVFLLIGPSLNLLESRDCKIPGTNLAQSNRSILKRL